MAKVKIQGLSRFESEVFEILEREELEKKIEELDVYDIYMKTIKEAYGYDMSGTAITYIDARNGEIKTYWLQNGTYNHPYDDFYEVVLCTLGTGTQFEIPIEEFFETREEQERYEESNQTLEEFFREEEYQNRLENIFDAWASEFRFDWEDIEKQLDELYSKATK